MEPVVTVFWRWGDEWPMITARCEQSPGRKPLIFHEHPPPDSVPSLPLPWVGRRAGGR